MSEALQEVTEELNARRRYVVPPVRDLDTGKVYAPNELEAIPKGVDPKVLSKQSKKLDLGHAICSPFLKLVPRKVHPNTISYINHAANWLLFIMAASGHSLPNGWGKTWWFLTCSLVNFLCMTLDCLDGMHARATNQCSKLGEFLDHWMDAINAPLVAAGAAMAFRLPQWNIAVMGALNAMVYCSQLIVYHYQRKFIDTSGVEAQLLTSVFYVLVALLSDKTPDEFPLNYFLTGVAWLGPWVCIYFIGSFAHRFSFVEWRAFLVFTLYLAPPIVLYMTNKWDVITYSLAYPIISFRITGSYVLYSIIQRPYKGSDWVLTTWLFVLLWTNFAMEPVPLSIWFSRFAEFVPSAFANLPTQSVLPWVFFIHIAQRNLRDFLAYYYSLKHL